MPRRLRPTAPPASDAILVGDPGRALLLAQELLTRPKMSNHARGLWGYSGRTAAGRELTIQSTGMGGPSAALVLADLAKLGLRRAVRVGTCAAVGERAKLGELLLPREAIAAAGSAASFGLAPGAVVSADVGLRERVGEALGGAGREATVASLDVLHREGDELQAEAVAADMQTVAVLARAAELGLAAAAILVVSEAGAERLDDEALAAAAARAGAGAVGALSEG